SLRLFFAIPVSLAPTTATVWMYSRRLPRPLDSHLPSGSVMKAAMGCSRTESGMDVLEISLTG
ncbi:glutamate receptor ionotropic kainate 4, partial [Biomphalaria pfeifferi]